MRNFLMGLILAGSMILGQAGTLVQFRTVFGDLNVELLDEDKPVTVQNFLGYIDRGRYMDSFFHRVVHNFIIQGGGFWVTNRHQDTGRILSIPTFEKITNEIDVGKFYSNVRGTIAMAKTSDPNSATSQFFFNLTNNADSLDIRSNSGGFTVFGRVVGADGILDDFNSFVNTNTRTNFIANAGSPFNQLPIHQFATNSQGGRSIELTNLVYVDITRLQVRVDALRDGRRGVRWNGIPGVTNRVEFTTVMPPQWQLLADVVPDNSAAVLIDSVVNTNRFYRVRTLR